MLKDYFCKGLYYQFIEMYPQAISAVFITVKCHKPSSDSSHQEKNLPRHWNFWNQLSMRPGKLIWRQEGWAAA